MHTGHREPQPTRPPSRPVLLEYAARQVVAAAVVGAAAQLAHQAGMETHVWPYVVMIGAIVPQVLLALVALGDDDRRRRLRPSRRPAPVPAALAVALVATAIGGWFAHQPEVSVLAAGVAALGLTVSALPTHVHVRVG